MNKKQNKELQKLPPPLSFEDHYEYIVEQSRLELFFLWKWLEKHPEEDFINALKNRIDLARKTDPEIPYLDKVPVNFNHPAWKRIEAGLADIYFELRKKNKKAEDFENAAYNFCKNDFRNCAEFSYYKGDFWAAFNGYQCGSLKYDPPSKESPETVFFHIKNALTPKSIFDEPEYLPACLRELMSKAEEEFNAKSLQTNTWLNSLPKWLQLFPEEWKQNMGNENKHVGWGYGHWGQFISASGKFNRKYGKILRETGEFPFWPKKSFCSFKSLREHLDKICS